MNILLIFFAIPLATIILSIIFQTLICNPLKVAGIAFSIFIIVAFALGGTATLIVAAIIYTILSLIAAFLSMFLQNRYRAHNVWVNNSWNNFNTASTIDNGNIQENSWSNNSCKKF